MAPEAWLRSHYLTRFEKIPTIYGPVSVRFHLDDAKSVLKVVYSSDYHHPPKSVVLQVPPIPTLSRVEINGQVHEAQPGESLITSGPPRHRE